jgi:aspartyl-tRNA(Asn)/glutamyl-tRNA(Gln) amidotransferase subunit B
MSARSDRYEPVIGLEVHAQLSTRSKMFCGCSAAYGGEPNTQVCPVCLGLPGALPVANARAVEFAVRMGVATHCAIADESVFARKNYFYPDCPKNYQISQYDTPLCHGGHLALAGGKRVGITRIHLEEDAGKLLHAEGAHSLVDMNRSGVPLIEIVSEPDIRSVEEASEYLQKLRSLVRYLGICDGNMEEGSLRCDVNVSVREKGSAELGVKTEVKNLNSFKQVEQALAYEFERQAGIVEAGGAIDQDTLLWNAERGVAEVMRSKEEAHDYRYFPEPDLPVLRVDEALCARVSAEMPELPDAKEARFAAQYKLPTYDAGVLTATREVADYFEAAAQAAGDAKAASNWVMGEVLRELNERKIEIAAFEVAPAALGELIRIQVAGKINSSTAKEVLREMITTGKTAPGIVAEKGLEQISDDDAIERAATEVLDAHPGEVSKYLAGKEKVMAFFVGQLMKATRGKANPKLATDIFKRLLEARRS